MFNRIFILAVIFSINHGQIHSVQNTSDVSKKIKDRKYKKLIEAIKTNDQKSLDLNLKNTSFDKNEINIAFKTAVIENSFYSVNAITQYIADKIQNTKVRSDFLSDFNVTTLCTAIENGADRVVEGILNMPEFDQKKNEAVIHDCMIMASQANKNEVLKKMITHLNGFNNFKIISALKYDTKNNSTDTLKHLINVENKKNIPVIDKVSNLMKINEMLKSNFLDINIKESIKFLKLLIGELSFFRQEIIESNDYDTLTNLVDLLGYQRIHYFSNKDIKKIEEIKLKNFCDLVTNDIFKKLTNSQNEKYIPLIRKMLIDFIDDKIVLSPNLVRWHDRQKENLLTKVLHSKTDESKDLFCAVLTKVAEQEEHGKKNTPDDANIFEPNNNIPDKNDKKSKQLDEEERKE